MDTRPLHCTLDQFQRLLDLLKADGYKLLGPTVRDEVIVYDELESAQDLPIGWMDEQAPGRYRLKRRNDSAYFGYNLGPHSWKKYLFPPREKIFSAKKQENGLVVFQETEPEIEKMAFIGAKACEIQAILVQDRVFMHKEAIYKQYKARRERVFILAANCTRSTTTCFCTTMGTGPKAQEGYDLALTEVVNAQEHYFILQAGSQKGEALCRELGLSLAEERDCQEANELVGKNAREMDRRFDSGDLHEMLDKSWNAKRWKQVAERCINCANCTMVCPTCFCSENVDKVNLDGSEVERIQSWDSCFNLSHSHVHGGSIRQSAQSRYRQWLTHKFGTWWDQFGVSGCVGCGRCIAWCPVGIDVREELCALKKEIHHEEDC